MIDANTIKKAREEYFNLAKTTVKTLAESGAVALGCQTQQGKAALRKSISESGGRFRNVESAMRVAQLRIDFDSRESVCHALRVSKIDNAKRISDFILGRTDRPPV